MCRRCLSAYVRVGGAVGSGNAGEITAGDGEACISFCISVVVVAVVMTL